MVDFVKYVLQEAKAKRLSHSDALEVMRQFHDRGARQYAEVESQESDEPSGFVHDTHGVAGEVKPTNTWLLQPQWQEQELDDAAVDHAEHIILSCELESASDTLQRHFPHAQCFELEGDSKDPAERFEAHAMGVFGHLQRILRSKEGHRVLLQVLVPQGDAYFLPGLSGLLKSAQLENPRVRGQLIELETTTELAACVKQNSRSAASHIRYHSGKRWVASLQPAAHAEPHMPWRPDGVYLVTGGAGGLGLIFADEIARRATGATVILTGRSPLDENKRARLAEFAALGAHVSYKQIDVADRQAVERLIQDIVQDHGRLNGIVHSAGVTRDSFLIKKSREELQAVLAPKVKGIVNLDLASRDVGLELFIVFSSLAGLYGNVGQADYAAANAFMDSYAQYRAGLVASDLRRGRTLSLNWPLWEEGGMGLDAATRQRLHSLGMSPLPTDKGIDALYRAMSMAGSAQVVVIEGNLSNLQGAGLAARPKEQESRVALSLDAAELDALRQKVCQQLKSMIGAATSVAIGRIDDEEPLTSYGIDSVMVMQLNDKLAAAFSDLPKTLFYEHQTLVDIAAYLVAEHQRECMDWVGAELGRPSPGMATPHVPVKKPKANISRGVERGRADPGRSRKLSQEGIDDSIAIIGLSGRFPGAASIGQFEERLAAGIVGDNSGAARRWNDPFDGAKVNQRWGVFLDEYDQFDPAFFGISRIEAEAMDPQERMFLMSCWHALEDSGYVSRRLQGSTGASAGETGVFVGVTSPTYNLVGFEQRRKGAQAATNLSFASISNRVSHFLNLTGPSLSVDTMCSSSLVAVHMACESIRSGECRTAIAGGVNLYLHPARLDMMRAANMLASDGLTRSIGGGGTGFVPGEAVAAIVLKPLRDAIDDRDNIHAVIKGGAMGHTGSTLNYMTPKSQAQAGVIQRALRNANVQPDDVDYVEMQWSGSDLADTMEIEGLRLGYRTEERSGRPLRIGSVKPNVGHAEAASGMAQLIKTVLQLKGRKFLKTVAAIATDSQADLGRKNIHAQLENETWEASHARPVTAGVSSHGAGGTGVHLLLESYERAPERPSDDGTPCLVVLSAKSRQALLASIEAHARFLEVHADVRLSDLAHTLQTGRAEFGHRWAAVASTRQELLDLLNSTSTGAAHPQAMLSPAEGVSTKRHADGVAQALVSGGYLQALGELWVSGMSVDWLKIQPAGVNHRRVSLPGYAFELSRCWPQQPTTQAERVVAALDATPAEAAVAARSSADKVLPPRHEGAAAIRTLVELSQSGLTRLGFVVAARVYEYLVELGLLIEGGFSHISKVTERLSSSKESGRVALRLLELLEREGLIEIADDGSFTVLDGVVKRMGDVRSSREMFLRACPEYAPCFQLLEVCLKDLFSAEERSSETPRREDALVEILTGPVRKGRLSDLVISAQLEEFFSARPAGRKKTLRVLEIGVGTLEYVSAIAGLNVSGNVRVDYRVASAVAGVTEQVIRAARSAYRNIDFSVLPADAVEKYVSKHAVDIVVIRTHDASGIDFLTSPEAIGRAFASIGLACVTSSTEDELVALLLELIFPGHISQHDKVIGEALRSGLLQAGCLHEPSFEPLASVYHRSPDAQIQAPAGKPSTDESRARLASVKKYLTDVFSDAVAGFEKLPPGTDLTTLGISSMTWAFIYARIAEGLGLSIDWRELSSQGQQASSLDSIAALVMSQTPQQQGAGNGRSMSLAAKVLQRLPRKVDVQLTGEDKLTRGLFTSSRGQQIEYYSCGSGPAIVFLTALAFSKSVWEYQICALADKYRLVFPHLPGHAGSRFEGVNFSFEDVADDLAELMSHMNIAAAHLAGWCMAGNISQIFALRHPERLKSLVLICTTPTDARLRGLTQQDLEEYSASPLISYRYEFQNIYNESSSSARIGRYLSVIEQAHVPVERGALLCLMLALFKFNTTQRLCEISVPTLIFSGAFDIGFPTDQVSLLKRGIPHAEYFEFKQGGHLPFLNQSELFNARLLEFLGLVDKESEVARIG